MYSHIIFDIDGTLLDTIQTGLLSLQKTILELLGKKREIEELYRYFGIPSYQAVLEIGFEDPDYAATIWEEYFQSLTYLITPFKGVEEMLLELHSKGKNLGIVTSRNRAELYSDPHMERLLPFFDCAICAEDSTKHKPNPEPVLAYLNKTGASPKESIYIGDTIYDCQCGKSAGVDFALINHRGIDESNLKMNADYFVSSIKELLPILK